MELTKFELVKKLDAMGVGSHHFDEMVVDMMAERTSAINNGGLISQIDFLTEEGCSADEILATANESLEDKERVE
jgi:hypothetical protein